MGFTGLRIFGDGSLSADGLAAGDTAVGRFIKASDPFNVTGGNVAIFQVVALFLLWLSLLSLKKNMLTFLRARSLGRAFHLLYKYSTRTINV